MTGPEKQARIDLACALRWANRLGYGEGICNHFSLEVPGRPGHFLINPQGLHWSEVTPGDLVVVDAAGRKVEGRYGVEPTAFFIHGAMHRSKPSAKCMLQVLAIGTGKPLRMIPERIAGLTAQQMAGDNEQAELHFKALQRLLDRDEPGWSRID